MLDIFRRYRGVLHYVAGGHPSLFYPLASMSPSDAIHNRVERDTELVLEGYPRSGNTFALHAFRIAQPMPVKTADHYHVPAQLILARRWRIPACVTFRNPEDVVRSLVVKYPFIRPIDALRGYLGFYRRIWALRDAFVAAHFDEIVTDFGAVIDRINGRFGTDFATFRHDEANVQRVFDAIDERSATLGHTETEKARPTDRKLDAKRCVDLSGCGQVLEKCEAIYRNYLALAGVTA